MRPVLLSFTGGKLLRDHAPSDLPAGNLHQAGADSQAGRERDSWLASLLHRLSRAIRGGNLRAHGAGEGVGRDTAAIRQRREALIPARQKAKRHHKRVSIYDRALRDLTTELLRRGA